MQTSFPIHRFLLLALLVMILGLGTVFAQTQPTPDPTNIPVPSPSPTLIVPPDGWELMWHDEFDATSIDAANWTYDLGGGGWGNGEAEYYNNRPENARLENGMLVIEAQKEKYEITNYSCADYKHT